MNAHAPFSADPEALPPLRATFRARQYTAMLWIIERSTVGGHRLEAAWFRCGHAYSPADANALAQDYAARFRAQHACEVSVVLAFETGRRPGQTYSVPADPAPGAGMTLRAEGFQTFIGRI